MGNHRRFLYICSQLSLKWAGIAIRIGAKCPLYNYRDKENVWKEKVRISIRKKPKFATTSLVSPRNDVWARNKCINSILMTCHYPNLGSAQWCFWVVDNSLHPITNTTQIWVVTRHQYGISALEPQTSFPGKSSGGIAKCRLFFCRHNCVFSGRAGNWSVLCRTALCDCFGDAIALFILLLELRGKRTGSKTVTKSSPTGQRTNLDTFRESSIDRIVE